MLPPNLDLVGYPSRTISILCTDTPQSIPTAELTFEGKPVVHMLISSEDGDARFTFGDATPAQATKTGHVIFPRYTYIYVLNSKAIRTFQFINADAGQANDAIMHITLFFERQ